ncbi:MAG: hypothetical protein V3V25_05410 [Paracoccaceae bacterium]
MGIALLLLGLLPLMFLPDMLDSDADSGDGPEDSSGSESPGNGDGSGDDSSLLDDPVDDGSEPDVLAPNDEDDLPDDGNQNPDPDDVLAPVDEDDVLSPSGGNGGDVLLPVDQIESDADTIWINFNDDAGLGYSEIEDFQAGQDLLHVLIDPDAIIGELDVEVIQSESGLDSMVYVEQQLVAILKGAPNATLIDVVVEIGVMAA